MVQVYILNNDGRLLYFTTTEKTTESTIENATLFSGIVTAIKSFLSELKVGDIRTFSTNENTILIRTESSYNFVLVLSNKLKVKEEELHAFLIQLSNNILPILKLKQNDSLIENETLQQLEEITKGLLQKFSDSFNESKATRNLLESLW